MTTSGLSLSPGSATGNILLVALDSHHELIKWTLYTERYGYDAPEFCCGNVREMTAYINAMAPELAQGIQPRFVLEKAAVGEYVRQHEGKAAYSIRREGESPVRPTNPPATGNIGLSRFRTLRRMFPQGFPAERAEQHGMLYVFPSKAPGSGQGRLCGAARTAQEGADAMTRRSHGRPALPPDAKDEILHVLFANMEIRRRRDRGHLQKTPCLLRRRRPAGPLPQAAGPAPHGQPPGRLR